MTVLTFLSCVREMRGQWNDAKWLIRDKGGTVGNISPPPYVRVDASMFRSQLRVEFVGDGVDTVSVWINMDPFGPYTPPSHRGRWILAERKRSNESRDHRLHQTYLFMNRSTCGNETFASL